LVTLNVQQSIVSDNLNCCCCRVLLFLQGLLKGEGKARYGDAWGMWQKQADAFAIDEHAPVRELWYR
jgi:hypothetical protein